MALDTHVKKPVRLWKRLGTVAIGHTAKQIEEYLFDWLLYGTVVALAVAKYGPLWGTLAAFAIMTPLSAIVCLFYIKAYDWAEVDLFGFEALKDAKDDLEKDGFIKRLVRRMIRLGDAPAFVALSITSDPFMTTIYLRRPSDRYQGLSPRDWRIFFGSVLLANGYWTFRWSVIVALATWAWELFPESVQSAMIAFWKEAVQLF